MSYAECVGNKHKLRLLRRSLDSSFSPGLRTLSQLPFTNAAAVAGCTHGKGTCQELTGQFAEIRPWEASGKTGLFAFESLCGSLAGFLYNPREESAEAKRWRSKPLLR